MDQEIREQIKNEIADQIKGLIQEITKLIQAGHKCTLERDFIELRTVVNDNIESSLPANLKEIHGELKMQTTLLKQLKAEQRSNKLEIENKFTDMYENEIIPMKKDIESLKQFKWQLVAKISMISAGTGAIISFIIYTMSRIIIKRMGY